MYDYYYIKDTLYDTQKLLKLNHTYLYHIQTYSVIRYLSQVRPPLNRGIRVWRRHIARYAYCVSLYLLEYFRVF